MKLSLTPAISTRDGTLKKDSKSVNLLANEKRPGLALALKQSVPAAGQGGVCSNGNAVWIAGGNLYDRSLISSATLAVYYEVPYVVAGTPSKYFYSQTKYGAGLFVGLGFQADTLSYVSNPYVSYSLDGVTWSQAPVAVHAVSGGVPITIPALTTSNIFTTLAYGIPIYGVAGVALPLFVAPVLYGDSFIISSDGISWTEVYVPAANFGWAANNTPYIVFAGGFFYCFAASPNTYMLSGEGTAFVLTTAAGIASFPGFTFQQDKIAYDESQNVLYVTCKTTGAQDGKIFRIKDGNQFTQVGFFPYLYLGYNAIGPLGAGNGLLVTSTVVANYWSSDKGVTWNVGTGALFTYPSNCNSISYANGVFWALAGNSVSGQFLFSTDGKFWVSGGTGVDYRGAQLGNVVGNGTTTLLASFFSQAPGGAQSHIRDYIPDFVYTSASIETPLGPYLFLGGCSTATLIKSTTGLWTYLAGVLTKVTTATYPAKTVPGLVNLDTTVYVMNEQGVIFGSALADPTTWNALNTINANSNSDCAVAITRHLNYVVAFKTLTTEFFYDAGSPPPGSPLAKNITAYTEMGCASAQSIVMTENLVIFMSRTFEKGRSISVLSGLQMSVISTPFVDKILNNDSLATVYSFAIKVAGHQLYVLTLASTGITLVYDFQTQLWTQWTSSYAKSAKTPTSITQVNGLATVTLPNHNFADGDPVDISGAVQTNYNGRKCAFVVDSNTFTFPVASNTVSPATGTLSVGSWYQSYFRGMAYINCNGQDLVQDEVTGNVFTITPTQYDDAGAPIDVMAVTEQVDGQNTDSVHRYAGVEVVADQVTTTAYLAYSDDDYQSWSKYRAIAMGNKKKRLLRQGAAHRRAYKFRHFDSTTLRINTLNIDVPERDE